MQLTSIQKKIAVAGALLLATGIFAFAKSPKSEKSTKYYKTAQEAIAAEYAGYTANTIGENEDSYLLISKDFVVIVTTQSMAFRGVKLIEIMKVANVK